MTKPSSKPKAAPEVKWTVAVTNTDGSPRDGVESPQTVTGQNPTAVAEAVSAAGGLAPLVFKGVDGGACQFLAYPDPATNPDSLPALIEVSPLA